MLNPWRDLQRVCRPQIPQRDQSNTNLWCVSIRCLVEYLCVTTSVACSSILWPSPRLLGVADNQVWVNAVVWTRCWCCCYYRTPWISSSHSLCSHTCEALELGLAATSPRTVGQVDWTVQLLNQMINNEFNHSSLWWWWVMRTYNCCCWHCAPHCWSPFLIGWCTHRNARVSNRLRSYWWTGVEHSGKPACRLAYRWSNKPHSQHQWCSHHSQTFVALSVSFPSNSPAVLYNYPMSLKSAKVQLVGLAF